MSHTIVTTEEPLLVLSPRFGATCPVAFAWPLDGSRDRALAHAARFA